MTQVFHFTSLMGQFIDCLLSVTEVCAMENLLTVLGLEWEMFSQMTI